jgi:hypothetical protein
LNVHWNVGQVRDLFERRHALDLTSDFLIAA